MTISTDTKNNIKLNTYYFQFYTIKVDKIED